MGGSREARFRTMTTGISAFEQGSRLTSAFHHSAEKAAGYPTKFLASPDVSSGHEAVRRLRRKPCEGASPLALWRFRSGCLARWLGGVVVPGCFGEEFA